MLRYLGVSVLAPALLLAAVAHADDVLLFDRGLPTANLNNAAGGDRSNVSWGDSGNASFTGDTFRLGTSPGTQYAINTVRIWTADGTDSSFNFLDNYISLTLYGQPTTGSGASIIEQGNFTGGTALDNPNIQIKAVTYADGSSIYQGSSGAFYQLWEVDFTNLNWIVDSDTLVNFGVFGETQDPGYYWVNHASNAAFSGSTQDGADGSYLDFADATSLLSPNSVDSNGNGWDKSSDINVQLFGSPVPEPGSWILLGTMVTMIGFRLRRRKML